MNDRQLMRRGELNRLLMPPQLREHPAQPDYLRIYHYYREHILLGTIRQDAKLPSIRALASHLGISRNPVETAYAHLVAEGYVENKPKSGYFAARVLQIPAVEHRSENFLSHSRHGGEEKPDIDFAYDRIQSGSFPLKTWKRLTQQALREASPELFGYGERAGELPLRRLIRDYVRQNRGVVCEAEQIIVTSGTQQSALLIGLLLRSGRLPLGVEAAMHPGLYRIFSMQMNRLFPIPLESDGVSCEALENSVPLCGVYVTPSHQFPYGSILPAAKRARLLSWAAVADAWIIEDDYDSEFIFDGRPLPALQGMDRNGRVIYMGTFSKALAPALRLGYLILPPKLLERYEDEFSHYDGTAARLTQITLTRFMEEGRLDRHIRKMRTIYNASRKKLMESLTTHFEDRAIVAGASSGLHMRLGLTTGMSAQELTDRARKAGIGIRPVTDFHVDPGVSLPENAAALREFVLGYGGLTGEQIQEGVRRLAEAWKG